MVRMSEGPGFNSQLDLSFVARYTALNGDPWLMGLQAWGGLTVQAQFAVKYTVYCKLVYHKLSFILTYCSVLSTWQGL